MKRAEARGTRAAPTAPVTPALVGPDNAVAVLGLSWREALHLARELCVPVVTVGARQVISARALVEAVETKAAPSGAAAEPTGEALVLARLGRGGA